MIAWALLVLGQTSPTVYVELPDALPAEVRDVLLIAVDTGHGAMELRMPSEPSQLCELRVRVELEREGRRANLVAHLNAEADGLDPTVLPLATGRFHRRGRVRFKTKTIELAATRLASEISAATSALRCEPEPPPARPEPTIDAELVTEARPAEPAPPRRSSIATLKARLGLGQRSFAYRDYLYGDIRSVQLELTPLASVSAELFPEGLLYIEGTFAAGLPTTEVAVPNESSASLGTQWLAASLRAGARIELLANFTAIAQGVARYESFDFSGDIPPELGEGLPSLQHVSAGAGIELRYEIERFRVRGAAHGLYCLSFGDFIDERFPQASGLGVAAEGSVLIPLSETLAVGPRAEWVRYGLSLNPEVGAENVAGGAVDQAWSAGVALEVEL